MEYKEEKRICQNCKKDFTIEPEDFKFYEKIKVPPPTFCRECRFQRRLAWRNERALYKRQCDLCKKNIFAMYREIAPFPVYCKECWYSDKWAPETYAKPYDFNRGFFEQYKELFKTVPRLAVFQRNCINSDYSNLLGESKNVYLSYSITSNAENIYYSKIIDKSTDIFDSFNIKEGQNLYEDVEGEKNYNSQYLLISRNCLDSYYLIDCVNCSNCFMCFNLRNKKFFIRNKQYSREEYFKELDNINLSSRNSREKLFSEFCDIKKGAIYKYANNVRSVDSTGNNLSDVRNCKTCFETYDSENLKYCYRVLNSFKDSMDTDQAIKSELVYEYISGALNDYNIKFSTFALNSVRNADYTDSCTDCNNIFGCISLKKKNYAILNKTYGEKEFVELKEKIIKQMNDSPYIDKNGRVYKYGEFFPIELSPWAYNETVAHEIFPLSKEEAEAMGYSWFELNNSKDVNITMPTSNIPDNISNIDDSVLNETIECKHNKNCVHKCTNAFRLTNYELTFYKKNKIPLPVLCPNCRYYERLSQLPALKLWHRKCMKEGCDNEFETSYAPDRPEIVYCERCYQQEVY